jgi:hypothetical protein
MKKNMDLYCGNCAEPWELFYVTEELTEEENVKFRNGTWCQSCEGKPKELSKGNKMRTEVSKMLGDMLGDDIDGIASDMDDFEYMGIFED